MLFSINFSLRISTFSLLHQKVVTNHILHHLPEGIEKFGPVHGTWMFAYETFNSWLCRRALGRKHPEATILRTYRVMLPVSWEAKHSTRKSIHKHYLSSTSVCIRAMYISSKIFPHFMLTSCFFTCFEFWFMFLWKVESLQKIPTYLKPHETREV